MHKKSVLMIGNLASQMGRGQAVCETMAALLHKRGWRLYIASGEVNRSLRLADMLSTAWRNRHEYQVAMIEVFSGMAFYWAEIMAFFLKRLGKTYLLALYGGSLPEYAHHHPFRVRKLLRSAQLVISPSLYTKEMMKDHYNGIRVLPYGTDLSGFPFRNRNKPLPYLITIRAFHNIYNLSLAPRVLSLLVDEFDQARLFMTGGNKGDGSWEIVQQMIAEKGLIDRVQMLGFVPREEIPDWLNKADIILNTTNVDNFPVSLIEAQACGLCIVSTNVGGIPYMLKHEHNALLVPPDDPPAMAAAVRRILTEPGLAEHLSCNAHNEAKHYDWGIVLPEWEALFEELGQV